MSFFQKTTYLCVIIYHHRYLSALDNKPFYNRLHPMKGLFK